MKESPNNTTNEPLTCQLGSANTLTIAMSQARIFD